MNVGLESVRNGPAVPASYVKKQPV